MGERSRYEEFDSEIIDRIIKVIDNCHSMFVSIYESLTDEYEINPVYNNISNGLDKYLSSYESSIQTILELNNQEFRNLLTLDEDTAQINLENKKKELNNNIDNYQNYVNNRQLNFTTENTYLNSNIKLASQNKIIYLDKLIQSEMNPNLEQKIELFRKQSISTFDYVPFCN